MPREQLQPVVRQIRRLAGDPPSERDDAFLLNQFAAHRDGQAFETLVRRHGRLVRSVCRHVLRCEEDAEDAFQATFLVLARRAGAVHGHRSLAAWLHGVALRAAWNARRSAMRRRQRDTSITTVAQREPEQPVTEAALREVQAILDEEVQRLPEKLRVPFVACCLEGKSKAEAARDLGWKEGTVSGRLAQARERLRDRLTRRGVSLSAALCALAVTSEATVALPGAVVTGTARAAIQFVTSGGEGQGAIVATQALRAMAGGKIKVAVLLTCSLLAVSAIGYQLSVGGGQPRDGTKPAVDEPKAESRQPRADLHGDPLPPGAVARMGTVRFRNGNLIAGVAYSPDGKWLASGGYGGTVRLHDSATGKEVRTLETQASQFPAIVFSPDGKTLATIGHKLVQLWETATGKELRRFAAEVSDHYAFEFVVPAVFSPDGKVLASVAEDHCVRLWDAETGKELHKLIGHKNPVRCLAYSRDAKVLYSATGDSVMGGSVRAWDVATGVELRKIALRGGGQAGQPGSPLGFSSNGQVLAFQAHEILRRTNVPRA
ncbi:MAG TPA: sigma-70 family RNA polymerase sigma factor, partial [Gemmataceae bacterium]|nr:sigma-70 family RNA polymerase sigma factor [Gemmataceae bacterium]